MAEPTPALETDEYKLFVEDGKLTGHRKGDSYDTVLQAMPEPLPI